MTWLRDRPLETRSTLTGRRYFNFRALPLWLQYVMSLATVAIVVTLAWRVGGGRVVPAWITRELVPSLGWIYLGLVAFLILYGIYRVRRSASSSGRRPTDPPA